MGRAGRGFLGGGYGSCKGPEVGMSLVHLNNDVVAGKEGRRQRKGEILF